MLILKLKIKKQNTYINIYEYKCVCISLSPLKKSNKNSYIKSA